MGAQVYNNMVSYREAQNVVFSQGLQRDLGVYRVLSTVV